MRSGVVLFGETNATSGLGVRISERGYVLGSVLGRLGMDR